MREELHEDIQKILEAAIRAPSGENCQPWRFEIRGGEIMIFNLPERDQSLYNYGQMASYVAHGALIENILIASPAFGYRAKFNLFPQEKDSNLVAIISVICRIGTSFTFAENLLSATASQISSHPYIP